MQEYGAVVLPNGAIAVVTIYENRRAYFSVYEENVKKYFVMYSPRSGKISVDGIKADGYSFLKKPPQKAIRDYYTKIMENLVGGCL